MNKFIIPKKALTTLSIFSLIGVVTLGVGFMVDSHRAWAALLVVGFFILSLSLSGGFFTSLQFISGSKWSVVVRRVPESMMMALPLAALIIVGIFFGIHNLYHWSHADVVKVDHILQKKVAYLNTTSFIIRICCYFIAWIGLWFVMRRISLRQDETKNADDRKTLTRLSAAFMLVFAYSFSMASIDLVMSLEPHWYSTMFGIYTFSGLAFSGMAAMIILIGYIKKNGGLKEVNEEHLHDVGKFQFMFVVFWAYIAFSQFMLIWYANLSEETIYLELRLKGEWKLFTSIFWILHFVVPFFVLLSREIKRDFNKLVKVAWYILFLGFVDVVWLVYGGIYENFHTKTFPFSWIELGAFIGSVGLFGLVVLKAFSKVNQIPLGDPYLEESKHFRQTH